MSLSDEEEGRKKSIKSHTDNFWIAFVQNQSRQNEAQWAANELEFERKMSVGALRRFSSFPGKLSRSSHSLERVGERSAFIISVCRVLAFKANARSSVWAPQREEGAGGGDGGGRAGIIGRGRTDPGAVPGSPGRGRKQDSSAAAVGNLGLKEGDTLKTFNLVWRHWIRLRINPRHWTFCERCCCESRLNWQTLNKCCVCGRRSEIALILSSRLKWMGKTFFFFFLLPDTFDCERDPFVVCNFINPTPPPPAPELRLYT